MIKIISFKEISFGKEKVLRFSEFFIRKCIYGG